MSEKRYFRFKSKIITVVYAFPAKIKVILDSKLIIETVTFSEHVLEGESDFEEITEAEFLQVFNEVKNEITLRYHNQFSIENQFIKNESLKSEGY